MFKKSIQYLYCTLLMFSIGIGSIPDVVAQHNEKQNKPVLTWVSLGFGGASGSRMTGASFTANAHIDTKFGLFGLRYMKADDNAIRGFWDYTDDITEISFTYGFARNYGILNVSASAGIGSFRAIERGPGVASEEHFRLVSFPLQGSITITPFPVLGLGLMYYHSINSHSNISGISAVLQLGRVR